jgi:hypothetical protein
MAALNIKSAQEYVWFEVGMILMFRAEHLPVEDRNR